MKKIFLIGGFGWKDIGDEAMPNGVIQYFLELGYSRDDFVAASPHPDLTKEAQNIEAIRDFALLQYPLGASIKHQLMKFMCVIYYMYIFSMIYVNYLLKTNMFFLKKERLFFSNLFKANIIFNVGGGNINSYTRGELLRRVPVAIFAKLYNKPFVLSGQTIGPFLNNIDRNLCRIILSAASYITFRDKNTSMELVASLITKNPDTYQDAADDAFDLECISENAAKELILAEFPDFDFSKLTISINLKASNALIFGSSDSQVNSEVMNFSLLSDWMQCEYDANVLYVSTDFNSVCDDRLLGKEIYRNCKVKNNVFVLAKEYIDKELKGILSIMDICVGSRYHYCVFASSMERPFLGLATGEYQLRKIKGLYDLCDLNEYYIAKNLSEMTFEEVRDAFNSIYTNMSSIRNKLKLSVPRMKVDCKKAVNYVHELLKSKGY